MSDELHTHKIIVDFAKGTNERIPLTAEEIAAFKKRDEEREAEKPQRQLAQIRELRNKLLAETDYLATADNTMSDAVKTWRQTLRDLPQNNTTEAKYDELLAKDSDGNLTNSVWTKPS